MSSTRSIDAIVADVQHGQYVLRRRDAVRELFASMRADSDPASLPPKLRAAIPTCLCNPNKDVVEETLKHIQSLPRTYTLDLLRDALLQAPPDTLTLLSQALVDTLLAPPPASTLSVHPPPPSTWRLSPLSIIMMKRPRDLMSPLLHAVSTALSSTALTSQLAPFLHFALLDPLVRESNDLALLPRSMLRILLRLVHALHPLAALDVLSLSVATLAPSSVPMHSASSSLTTDARRDASLSPISPHWPLSLSSAQGLEECATDVLDALESFWLALDCRPGDKDEERQQVERGLQRLVVRLEGFFLQHCYSHAYMDCLFPSLHRLTMLRRAHGFTASENEDSVVVLDIMLQLAARSNSQREQRFLLQLVTMRFLHDEPLGRASLGALTLLAASSGDGLVQNAAASMALGILSRPLIHKKEESALALDGHAAAVALTVNDLSSSSSSSHSSLDLLGFYISSAGQAQTLPQSNMTSAATALTVPLEKISTETALPSHLAPPHRDLLTLLSTLSLDAPEPSMRAAAISTLSRLAQQHPASTLDLLPILLATLRRTTDTLLQRPPPADIVEWRHLLASCLSALVPLGAQGPAAPAVQRILRLLLHFAEQSFASSVPTSHDARLSSSRDATMARASLLGGLGLSLFTETALAGQRWTTQLSAALGALGSSRHSPAASPASSVVMRLVRGHALLSLATRDADRALGCVTVLEDVLADPDPLVKRAALASIDALCRDEALSFFAAWKVVVRFVPSLPRNGPLAAQWVRLLGRGVMEAASHEKQVVDLVQLLWSAAATGLRMQEGEEAAYSEEDAAAIRVAAYEALICYPHELVETLECRPSGQDVVARFMAEPNERVRRSASRWIEQALQYDFERRRRYANVMQQAMNAATAFEEREAGGEKKHDQEDAQGGGWMPRVAPRALEAAVASLDHRMDHALSSSSSSTCSPFAALVHSSMDHVQTSPPLVNLPPLLARHAIFLSLCKSASMLTMGCHGLLTIFEQYTLAMSCWEHFMQDWLSDVAACLREVGRVAGLQSEAHVIDILASQQSSPETDMVLKLLMAKRGDWKASSAGAWLDALLALHADGAASLPASSSFAQTARENIALARAALLRILAKAIGSDNDDADEARMDARQLEALAVHFTTRLVAPFRDAASLAPRAMIAALVAGGQAALFSSCVRDVRALETTVLPLYVSMASSSDAALLMLASFVQHHQAALRTRGAGLASLSSQERSILATAALVLNHIHSALLSDANLGVLARCVATMHQALVASDLGSESVAWALEQCDTNIASLSSSPSSSLETALEALATLWPALISWQVVPNHDLALSFISTPGGVSLYVAAMSPSSLPSALSMAQALLERALLVDSQPSTESIRAIGRFLPLLMRLSAEDSSSSSEQQHVASIVEQLVNRLGAACAHEAARVAAAGALGWHDLLTHANESSFVSSFLLDAFVHRESPASLPDDAPPSMAGVLVAMREAWAKLVTTALSSETASSSRQAAALMVVALGVKSIPPLSSRGASIQQHDVETSTSNAAHEPSHVVSMRRALQPTLLLPSLLTGRSLVAALPPLVLPLASHVATPSDLDRLALVLDCLARSPRLPPAAWISLLTPLASLLASFSNDKSEMRRHASSAMTALVSLLVRHAAQSHLPLGHLLFHHVLPDARAFAALPSPARCEFLTNLPPLLATMADVRHVEALEQWTEWALQSIARDLKTRDVPLRELHALLHGLARVVVASSSPPPPPATLDGIVASMQRLLAALPCPPVLAPHVWEEACKQDDHDEARGDPLLDAWRHILSTLLLLVRTLPATMEKILQPLTAPFFHARAFLLWSGHSKWSEQVSCLRYCCTVGDSDDRCCVAPYLALALATSPSMAAIERHQVCLDILDAMTTDMARATSCTTLAASSPLVLAIAFLFLSAHLEPHPTTKARVLAPWALWAWHCATMTHDETGLANVVSLLCIALPRLVSQPSWAPYREPIVARLMVLAGRGDSEASSLPPRLTAMLVEAIRPLIDARLITSAPNQLYQGIL